MHEETSPHNDATHIINAFVTGSERETYILFHLIRFVDSVHLQFAWEKKKHRWMDHQKQNYQVAKAYVHACGWYEQHEHH